MVDPNKWPAADEAKLRKLWEIGLSGTEISRRFDSKYSRCAVLGKADRIGLKARHSLMNRHLTGPRTKPKAGVVPLPPPSDLIPLGPLQDFPAPGLCRFPMNLDGTPFQCCGRPIQEGSPYCGDHHAVCRVRPAPRP